VTLPKEIRRKAEIRPGDKIQIQAIGKGEVRITVLPNLSPRELRDLYPIDRDIDEARDRPEWESLAASESVDGDGA
jgi:bifunctional DNA-binding transcriptional regulator/antitoxin component of YhaV-PrlF toxin-antitoxin module